MPEAFVAETAVRGDAGRRSLNLNVTLVDEAGASTPLSLSPAAVTELAGILKDHVSDPRQGDLARIPKDFSVGHGRYERMVLVKFEDDVAYAFAPEFASELAEALAEEASNIARMKMPARQ